MIANTAIATICSPVDAPVCAIAAAAPTISSRFFGLIAESTIASPAARAALNRSIAAIHDGDRACAPSRGRPRHCLTATPRSRTPRTTLSTLTQSAGAPPSLASAPLETTRTIAPTAAIPVNHPAMNAGPFARARGVPSISTTPMMGIGLSATPTPNDRT